MLLVAGAVEWPCCRQYGTPTTVTSAADSEVANVTLAVPRSQNHEESGKSVLLTAYAAGLLLQLGTVLQRFHGEHLRLRFLKFMIPISVVFCFSGKQAHV